MTDDANHDPRRREFLQHGGALGAAVAALATAGAAPPARTASPRGLGLKQPSKLRQRAPFKDLREYLAAMDEYGLVARFRDVDQDAWEATAIMYMLTDRFGLYGAPIAIFENIKVAGRWMKGPVIGNHQSHMHQEAIVWGLEPDFIDPHNSYRAGLKHMVSMLNSNGSDYPQVAPVFVERAAAPCKEVVLDGEAIDLTSFAFIQGNPADAGRYINTGSTICADPEWQQNIGTYRCQIAGPRLLYVNSEPGQTGYRMFQRARERGEKSLPLAIVLGQDPVTWMVSGSRVPITGRKPIDELAYVGGMRGQPLEVIKADSSSLVIPAHCEMVIEGDLDLTRVVTEGPYHETYGYLGDSNDDRHPMTVRRVTHRRNPLLPNSFTSIGGGFVRTPMDAYSHVLWTKRFPQIQQLYYHDDTKGITYISIKKDKPGLGLEIAKAYSERSMIAKLVVVVDDDLDVMNQAEMLLALGSRWQPGSASEITRNRPASFFEPSTPDAKTTSKIAIDATMQWPEEGGRKEFPGLNRNLFERAAPGDVYARVIAKWPAELTRKPW